MPIQPTRPVKLLERSGFTLETEVVPPPSLANAKRAWAFSTSQGRIGIWIYEFTGQKGLDVGVSQIEQDLIPRGRAIDFAQNGEYLLVLSSNTKQPSSADRETITRILQSFSGEVER